MGRVLTVLSGVFVLGLAYIYVKLTEVPPVPQLEDTWWGPGKEKLEDDRIRPFSINISNEIIEDLKYRLDHHIPFQPSLEDAKQWYGMNAKLLQSVIEYWRKEYDWPKRQAFLNQYPHFKTKIQGLDIHFIHVKPQNTKGLKVRPLLIVHGWPGSVREFYEIIPLLTTPREGEKFVFEVIAPSLPGYGFSDAAVRSGLGPAQIGHMFRNLMFRLGHKKFYLQGGDWGSVITQHLTTVHPESVIGLHCNMYTIIGSQTDILKLLLGVVAPSMVVDEREKELNYPLSGKFRGLLSETGYFYIQATKPDTIGFALRDSPVGLAAYILEKFTTATNRTWRDREDGGLTEKFTMDQLLDNVMIYWVTRSKTTSIRLYAEYASLAYQKLGLNRIPIKVPSGISRFPNEIFFPPKSILKGKFHDLVYVKDHDKGGHFIAFEEPELLAEDIFEFVNVVENLSSKNTNNKETVK